MYTETAIELLKIFNHLKNLELINTIKILRFFSLKNLIKINALIS